MARPHKIGLSYFPLDVDFMVDDKFQIIDAKYGSEGVVLIIKLFCKIYRNGYFINWNPEDALMFHNNNRNFAKEKFDEFINDCLRKEIFDKNMFDLYGILTSHGIQSRYFEASRKRKFRNGFFQYLLVDLTEFGVFNENTKLTPINSNLTLVNSELTPVNSELSTQIKEKKSILNNIISETTKNDFPEEIKNLYNSFNEAIKAKYPRISKMDKQITITEFNSLLNDVKINIPQINNILERMENYKSLLTNNTSVFLTIKAWYKKDCIENKGSNASNDDVLERKTVLIGKW